MKISDMNEFKTAQDIVTAKPTDTVANTVQSMARANKGAAVVTNDEGGVAGVFTERDLLAEVIAQNKDPAKIAVSDVMTTDVITARADEFVADAINRIGDAPFRHFPILDAEGKITGILTERDFAAYTLSQALTRAAESTKETVSSWYQPFLIIAAAIIYTALIVFLVLNIV